MIEAGENKQTGVGVAVIVAVQDGARVVLSDPAMLVSDAKKLWRKLCSKRGELSALGVDGLSGRVTEAWLLDGGGTRNYKRWTSVQAQGFADKAKAEAAAPAEDAPAPAKKKTAKKKKAAAGVDAAAEEE